MELNGQQYIAATRKSVWDALIDPAILSRCIPGCEEIIQVSDTEMHARVLMKLGPVRARFSGKLFMSDVLAPTSCTLSFEGAGGAAGFAKGRSQVNLVDEEGGTRLSYTVEASVGGKLGQIGGRLIDSSAKKMADEFFTAFNAALTNPERTTHAHETDSVQPAGVDAKPNVLSGARVFSRPESASAAFAGGFKPELYRAFWFSFGVAFTLLMSRWVA
jgi:hypothetical protein